MSNNQTPVGYEGTDVLENLVEAKNYNHQLKKLILQYSKPGKCLDFGAGIGTFSEMVQDELSPECFEIDEKQNKVLKDKGMVVHENFDSLQEKYQYIFSLNVIEHIEEDESVIKQLLEKLEKGGRLFIFVPAFNHLYSDFDKALGHHRRYNKASLLKLFEGTPSKIIQLQYFDFMGYLAALTFKFLSMKSDSVSKEKIKFFDRFLFPLNFFFDWIFQFIAGKNVLIAIEKE